MDIDIDISNEQDVVAFEGLEALVMQAVTTALTSIGIDNAEVSVVFVDDEAIQALNLEYRGQDVPTDVLSFPLEDLEPDLPIPDMGGIPLALGDIVVSLECAERQATEYGHSLRREVGFLVVHGILHLLGYDHETDEEDATVMRAKEEEILRKMELPR